MRSVSCPMSFGLVASKPRAFSDGQIIFVPEKKLNRSLQNTMKQTILSMVKFCQLTN